MNLFLKRSSNVLISQLGIFWASFLIIIHLVCFVFSQEIFTYPSGHFRKSVEKRKNISTSIQHRIDVEKSTMPAGIPNNSFQTYVLKKVQSVIPNHTSFLLLIHGLWRHRSSDNALLWWRNSGERLLFLKTQSLMIFFSDINCVLQYPVKNSIRINNNKQTNIILTKV